MTIEQLQYFYAVSVHKTFSLAALEMNITQSALSKQIAKLEQELGIFLLIAAIAKSLLHMMDNSY